MTVKAGDIVIELNLDNSGFTAKVKDSGQVLRQLQGDFTRTASSVKRMEEHTTSLSTKFRHLVMTLGNLRFVAMDINDVFLRLPVAILKTAGEMERLEKTMTGLSNKFTDAARAAEGAMNFKFVTDLAKKAPFEIAALADAFIKFKTGGIDPTNGSLNALVDSVARFGGNSESLKRASVAIQQMLGKGVVSMEELRQQLGEAVPTAMRDMADGMGLTMAELAAKIKTGTVEASSAIDKMLLRMKINNEGAAENMMDTWVGSLARLKTEWALTAKFIYEQSGFGDAAKTALDAMSGAMSSDEFKRFAVEFGNSLKTAIDGFVAFSKVVVENRDAIKLAVEAFVAYKAGTAIIYPALRALQTGMVEKRAAIMGSIQASQAAVAADRAHAIQEASNSLYRTEKRQAELAATLARHQQELASVRARNAAILLEDQKLAAERARLERIAYVPGLNNSAARDQNLARMAELSRKNSELIARERELAQAVASTTVAMNASNAAAAQKVANLAAVTAAASGSARAAAALGVAMNGLKFAFNAVGGWLGVITIALLAGIEMWRRYGRAAEEAMDRKRRAEKGLATEDDQKAEKKELDEARKQLADAERAAKVSTGSTGSEQRVAGAIAAQRAAAVEAARRRVMESEARMEAIAQTVRETQARDRAEQAQKITDAELRGIQRRGGEQIRTADEWARAQLETLDKNDKGYAAKEKKINAERVARQAAAIQENRQAQIAHLEQQRKQAEEAFSNQGLSNEERDAANARAKALSAQIDEKRAELQGIEKTLNSTVGTVGGKDKKAGAGPKESPIQRMIEQLEAENAGLQKQVDALGKTLTAAEIAQARMAEIDALFKSGRLDGAGKNGVKATQADVDRLKAAETKRIFNEQLIKDSQDFTSRMEQLAPRYTEAMEILADPLGLNKSGATLRRADAYLAGLSEDRLRAIANVMKMDTEALKAKFRGMAAVVDATPEFQRMAEQTKQLNEQVVDDTRQAAKARQAAANETYRNWAQNEVDKVRASAAGNAEIIRMADEMQETLNRNMAARARDLEFKFRSPMEEMVARWENSTRNMEEASAQWADRTIDALTTTGKSAKEVWGDLVKSILADLIKIQAKKHVGGAIGGLFDAVIKGFGGGDDGGGFGTGADFGNMDFGAFFAKGGIMTPQGSLPLRKYAAGGIANSPQMAIFGEGDKPEAYVPLPDGRRIPVAMQGGAGGAPAVTVNVINQTGQPVNAQQGQQRFDGRQMVLDVVLSAANQPGPFRDGMRGAMK